MFCVSSSISGSLFIVSCGFLLANRSVRQVNQLPSQVGKSLTLAALPLLRVKPTWKMQEQADIDVYVKGPNGAPLDGSAVVTLTKLDGAFVDQKTAKNGYARFNGVRATEYKIQVSGSQVRSN